MVEMHQDCIDFLKMLQKEIDPRICIKRKTSWWWKLLPKSFQRASTTLGWTLWVRPESKALTIPDSGLALLVHESDHWLKRKQIGRLPFFFKYLFDQGRFQIELSAYAREWAFVRYVLILRSKHTIDSVDVFRVKYVEVLLSSLKSEPYYIDHLVKQKMRELIYKELDLVEKEISIPPGATPFVAALICTGLV